MPKMSTAVPSKRRKPADFCSIVNPLTLKTLLSKYAYIKSELG